MNYAEIDVETRHQLMLIITFFVFVTGSCIGSFLNVVIWRLPRGESLSHPSSHCPACHHPLAVWQNVPLLGWLVLRGRCFYCKTPISVRYPIVEMITALLFLAVWGSIVQAGLPWGGAIRYLFLAGALLAAAIIDAEHRIIPDKITYTGMGVAVACSALYPASMFFPGFLGGMDAAVLAALPLPESCARLGTVSGALLVSGVGMGLGAALPALARCGGNLLWGQTEIRLPTATTAFALTPAGLRLGETTATALADLIGPAHERCALRVDSGKLRWRTEDGSVAECELRNTTLFADAEFMECKGRLLPANSLIAAEGTVSRARITREVLGLGDVKLMAMCGAFLGISATVEILLLASAAALAAGIPALILRRKTGVLAFGPFISLAGLAVFFFGDRLALWYGHVILGALFM